jgi:hypothetical protein
MWPKSLLPATSPNNRRPINTQAKVSQITSPYEAIPSYHQYQELQASALSIIPFYKEGHKKGFSTSYGNIIYLTYKKRQRNCNHISSTWHHILPYSTTLIDPDPSNNLTGKISLQSLKASVSLTSHQNSTKSHRNTESK